MTWPYYWLRLGKSEQLLIKVLELGSLWWRKGYVRRPKTRWIFDRQIDNERTFEETFFWMLVNLKFTLMQHINPDPCRAVLPSCPPTCVCASGLFGRPASVNWFQQLCSVGSAGSSGASHELQVYSSKRTIWQAWQLPAATRRPPRSSAQLRRRYEFHFHLFFSLISSLAYFLLHFGLSLPAAITITIPDTQLNIYLHRLCSPQPRKSGWVLGLPAVSLIIQAFSPASPPKHSQQKARLCMHLGKVVLHFLENKWFIF